MAMEKIKKIYVHSNRIVAIDFQAGHHHLKEHTFTENKLL